MRAAVMGLMPSHLRRRRAMAWGRLLTRALAAAGLLLAAGLAAIGHRGLLCLGFLTATALVMVAALRARGALRRARIAVRFDRGVREALGPLAPAGWELKHNVRWPDGPGEGHLALIPGGRLAFAIKNCPEALEDFDLAQTQDFATALSQTGRPYIPVCVGTVVGTQSLGGHGGSGDTGDAGAAASAVYSFSERGVLCCTPHALATELIEAERAFLTSLADEGAHLRLLYSD